MSETLTIKPRIEKPDYVKNAREAYDRSLQRLALALLNSRKSRDIWMSDRNNVAKKEAYADARDEHKAALDEIQVTRAAFREANARFKAELGVV